MNTPDSQHIQQTQDTPNAPLANRVRATDERPARQVRRRLDFDVEGNDPTPPAAETHWRLEVIEVRMIHGFPVHEQHTITVELYEHPNPGNTTFNEALDDGRLARGSTVHRNLLESGHVALNVNWDMDRRDFASEEEYKRQVNEMFRSITYIKL